MMNRIAKRGGTFQMYDIPEPFAHASSHYRVRHSHALLMFAATPLPKKDDGDRPL